jgi:5'-nucleotidase
VMFAAPLDLTKARILLSNDDGIAAPGLKVLERALRSLSRDVWIVAPEHEQSGAGHSLTLRRPLRIRRLGARRFAVDGTPTDSVLLGIRQIMRDHPPDLLVSGINLGANIGEDVTYSGTVAAAMEGTLLQVPSIAVSLAVTHGATPHWDTAARLILDVAKRLAIASWPANTLMNVNIPNIPVGEVTGIRACAQGQRRMGDNLVEGTDPRGQRFYWVGPNRNENLAQSDSDIAIVAAGGVAVTPINLDLTHQAGLAALRSVFP